MGRTTGNKVVKDPAEKKEDRNRRMKKFGLNYVRPSKVEKDLRHAQSKDGRVGRGAAEHLAAMLEFFFDQLWKRLAEEAGQNHQIQLVHVAKALADPESGFHGIFPTRVAGVFLPAKRPEIVSKKDRLVAASGGDVEEEKKKKKVKKTNKVSSSKKPKKEKVGEGEPKKKVKKNKNKASAE
jgi:hypothetical protein